LHSHLRPQTQFNNQPPFIVGVLYDLIYSKENSDPLIRKLLSLTAFQLPFEIELCNLHRTSGNRGRQIQSPGHELWDLRRLIQEQFADATLFKDPYYTKDRELFAAVRPELASKPRKYNNSLKIAVMTKNRRCCRGRQHNQGVQT
jgi:hypothetical protein